MDWFRDNMDSRNQDMMLNALVTGEIETFQEIFQDYVMDTFSVFDTGGKDPEKVYHAFVLGLLVHLRSRYEVKSNRESGFGRYDVMLIPRNHEAGKGVIIEFKKVRNGETMQSAAASALQQIVSKQYAEELIARGIPEIIKMAIVFAGKEVLIETL
jgi:hypothetical protein